MLKSDGQIEDKTRPYYNFINSIDSQATKDIYQFHLNRFMSRCHCRTLADFLNLPVLDIENILIDYIVEMKAEELSGAYITVALAALKHLCVMNDVRINKEKVSKFIGEKDKKHTDRAYTHEEIKAVLDVCDLRVKVIVLILASTGVRIGVIHSLKLKHLEPYGNIYRFTIYEKTRDEYVTFGTPELTETIMRYLAFRERSGEKLTPDSYLIRDQFDMTDLEQIRKRSKGVSKETVSNILHHYLVKSGIRVVNHNYSGKERHPVSMCHGFRKFTTTQLVNARVIAEIREMILGHKIGIVSAYYRPTLEEMQTEYEKAIDLLTIDPANRLQRKVEKLEIEKTQFEALASEIQEIKKTINAS